MVKAQACWLMALLSWGCTPAPSMPRPDPPTVVSEGPSAPLVTALPPTALPGRCTLRTTSWAGHHLPVALRFGPESEPFAFLIDGAAELTLGGDPAAGARLTSRSQGITLKGSVRAGDVGLLPSRALVFEGFVIPLPTTSLVHRGRTETGEQLVQHDLVVSGDETRSLTREVACDDLSLDVGSFNADHQIGLQSGGGADAIIAVHRLPLSAAAGDLPIVTFSLRSGREVTVLDRSSAWARIRWYRSRELVFGWVPNNLLKPFTPGNMWGDSIGQLRAPQADRLALDAPAGLPPQRLACDQPVELIGEIGGRWRPVGEIAPATVFEIYLRRGPLTQVFLQTTDLRLAGQARWLVAAADLARCQRQ
jgi:hypothetical protein